MSTEEQLDRINDEMATTLIPAIVLVALYMVIGLIGNPLVTYYFGCRAKATSSYHFIVALSIFDMVTCCVSMPLEIVDMRNSYKFENTIACKILRFVNHFASISSGTILIAIAVDRYRKVCHPFGKQITLRMTKIIIMVVCMFSLCVSWPSIIFYGSDVVNITSIPGLIGHDCTTVRDDSYKLFITLYNTLLCVIFLTAMISIIVLYSLTGKRLFNLKSFQFYAAQPTSKGLDNKSQNSSELQTSYGISSRSSTKIFEIPDETDEKPLATIKELDPQSRRESMTSSRPNSTRSENRVHPEQFQKEFSSSDIKHSNEISDMSISKTVSTSSINFSNGVRNGSAMSNYSDRSRSTRQGSAASEKSRVSGLSEYSDSDFVPESKTRDARGSVDIDAGKKLHAQNVDIKKYTAIMLSISIAFIVSFLPYLGLQTWRTLAKEHEFNLFSGAELVAYQIFIRSFLISSFVNPLIYGLLNTEFRSFVKNCFCCCCRTEKLTTTKKEPSHTS